MSTCVFVVVSLDICRNVTVVTVKCRPYLCELGLSFGVKYLNSIRAPVRLFLCHHQEAKFVPDYDETPAKLNTLTSLLMYFWSCMNTIQALNPFEVV